MEKETKLKREQRIALKKEAYLKCLNALSGMRSAVSISILKEVRSEIESKSVYKN